MPKILRNLFVFLLIVLFILAFSSSYASLSIDNLAYILAIGIDTSDNNNLEVTFQFSTTTPASESGSTEKTSVITNSVKAASLSNAINLMNSYMGKELNMSHCKVIIFSEELAIQGISDEFIPSIVNLHELDDIISVDDGDAIIMAQMLSKELGLGVGISSGANFIGAIKALDINKSVSGAITIFADDNKKYISTDLMNKEPVKSEFISSDVKLLDFRVL